MFEIIHNDCLVYLKSVSENTFDSIVTDPPYGLSFMGKKWDKALPDPEIWKECLRVLKPGGHMIVFGAPRLYHRLTCQIEDAGFEVRDCLMWLFGSGFPKSLDVSKAIDKEAGAKREVVGYDASRARPNRLYEGGAIGNVGGTGKVSDRTDNGATITAPSTPEAIEWDGWGTALKPAYEPILLVRKPLTGTVASNVLKHGTGGINIDGCRIETTDNLNGGAYSDGVRSGLPGDERETVAAGMFAEGGGRLPGEYQQPSGRWPANIILDEEAGTILDAQTGGASRFFYCAKTSKSEREAGLGGTKDERQNNHPTVKPISLMKWLVKLITPPGGTVLDPFTGSGSTGCAAVAEGFSFVGCELEEEYVNIARKRIANANDETP